MLGRRLRPSEMETVNLPLGAPTTDERLSLDFALEASEVWDKLEVGGLPSCERVRGVWGGVAWFFGGAKAPCVSFSASPVNCEVEGCREVEDALGVGLGSGWQRRWSDSAAFSLGAADASSLDSPCAADVEVEERSEEETGAGEGLTRDDFRRGIRESRT